MVWAICCKTWWREFPVSERGEPMSVGPFPARWLRLKPASSAVRDEGAAAGGPAQEPVGDLLGEAGRLALRTLLHSAEFNRSDGLNEYDGDYRVFSPLGDVLTQDMLRAVERLAESAAADLVANAPNPQSEPPTET